jgi:hypothetical protein
MSSSEQDRYVAELGSQERIVLGIARAHLGTSFDLVKSSGYQAWIRQLELPPSLTKEASANPCSSGGPRSS